MSDVEVPSEPGDSSRVTTFQLYQKLVDLERSQEARIAEIRGDMRAVRQTLDESITPTLREHGEELDRLRARFVYALTVIGSGLGAVTFLVLRGKVF